MKELKTKTKSAVHAIKSHHLFDKIVVFDLNLDWINSTEASMVHNIFLIIALIKKAAKQQIVVLTTSASLNDLLNFAKKIGLHSGFLVCNFGSLIYDLKKKKIVYDDPISLDDVKMITHTAAIINTNFVLNSVKQKATFSTDLISENYLVKNSYSQIDKIADYDGLEKFFNSNKIYSINLFSTNSYVYNRNLQLLENNLQAKNLRITKNATSNFIVINNITSSKCKAIIFVMQKNNVLKTNDVLYIACSCVDNECLYSFNNVIINDTEKILTEVSNRTIRKFSNGITRLDLDFGAKTGKFWQ